MSNDPTWLPDVLRAEEYDLWNQHASSVSHNLVVASNEVDAAGTYQAQWTSAVTTAGANGTIALRPAA